jgi:hypothetical protein
MPKTINWIDHGREPTQKPNPDYPDGIDLDSGERPACKVELPYPAKRCGVYIVKCDCGVTIAITTAGRPDDPRSVMVPCARSDHDEKFRGGNRP